MDTQCKRFKARRPSADWKEYPKDELYWKRLTMWDSNAIIDDSSNKEEHIHREMIRQKYKEIGEASRMKDAKRMIWVTFRKEGIHKYCGTRRS